MSSSWSAVLRANVPNCTSLILIFLCRKSSSTIGTYCHSPSLLTILPPTRGLIHQWKVIEITFIDSGGENIIEFISIIFIAIFTAILPSYVMQFCFEKIVKFSWTHVLSVQYYSQCNIFRICSMSSFLNEFEYGMYFIFFKYFCVCWSQSLIF